MLTGSINRYFSSVCVHVPKKLSLDGLQLAFVAEHALTMEWCGMVLRVVWAGPTVGATHWFESLLLGLVWSKDNMDKVGDALLSLPTVDGVNRILHRS